MGRQDEPPTLENGLGPVSLFGYSTSQQLREVWMNKRFSRSVLVTLAAMSLSATAALAQMDRLEMVAPGGPGSGQDQVARAVAQALQKEGIVRSPRVLNIAGGGGMVAFAQFISSKQGDPNAVLTQGAGHILFPISNKTKVSIDDVTPLALLAGEWEVIVTKKDSGINSIKNLLEKFKAAPGSVTWAGGSPAATDHVFMANLIRGAGLDPKLMNFVPHENTGDIVVAVLGGQVSVGAGGYQDFAQQVESGALKVLAVAAPERQKGVDAPTLKEEGIDLVFANWRGVSAHKSLTEEQLKALDEVFAKLAKSDTWKKIMAERGWLDMYLPRAEYAAYIKNNQESATAALKALGMIK
jgi:putative tricarboxylic transport membrane protein